MLRFPVHLLLSLILFFFPPHLILLHPVFFQFFKPANLFFNLELCTGSVLFTLPKMVLSLVASSLRLRCVGVWKGEALAKLGPFS